MPRLARTVLLGPWRVSVVAPDDPSADRLARLLGALPEGDGADTTMEISGGPPAAYRLTVDGAVRVEAGTLWEVEDRLLSNLNGWLLARETDRLHLHAALVSRHGVGVLLVAPSGSGKSTLTAHLVRHGWTYHTDESAAAEPGTGRWGSYPRPLTLKRGSWGLFGDLPAVGDVSAEQEPGRDRIHLPPTELGPHSSGPVTVAVVAFVDHRLDREAEPIDAASAMRLLVADTLDLERAGGRGIDDLARLTRQAELVRLPSADLERAADHLAAAVDRASSSGATPAVEETDRLAALPRAGTVPLTPAAVTAACRPRRGWQVHTAAVPGGVALYDTVTGHLLPLDAPGAAVWSQLDGGISIADLSALVAAESGAAGEGVLDDLLAFAADLAAAGLLDVDADPDMEEGRA